jgi:SAM-dependent methyltransferase
MNSSRVHRVRTECRACGRNGLTRFLQLGEQPLANSFLREASEFADEPRFPLDLYYCSECFLVQLVDVIDPSVLFRNYLYVTGTSDTIAEHNVRYAATIVELLDLGPDDLVVEVASNDGSLLKRFRDHGVRTLGVEPATNIAVQARAEGLEVLDVFFTEAAAEDIRASHSGARAVIGNNVLAHVDDTRGFLAGARKLLAPGGLVVTEVPYLGPFLDRLEYDTVYHEHLCYFSVGALARLCEAVGLAIVRIDDVPVHGGSVRMYAANASEVEGHAPAVLERIRAELERGMQDPACYAGFAERVVRQRDELQQLLRKLRAEGAQLAGYGAPAKGNTLLNFCQIDVETIPYLVDKSDMKVGLYTPGTHIPVMPVSTLLERQPDYVLILAWNFAPEIMRQQSEYAARGGRFIVPIPEPRVVAA